MFKIIYEIVKKIPPGKVLTYKAIGDHLKIRNYRLVGWALHRNLTPHIIPCHRIVKADGSLAHGYAFGGIMAQRKKLRNEKVFFSNPFTVNLQKSMWKIKY